MKLKDKLWLNFSKKKFKKIKKKVKLSNQFFIYPKIFKKKKNFVKLKFNGSLESKSVPVLKVINKSKTVLGETTLNREIIVDLQNTKFFFVVLYIPDNCDFNIDELEMLYLDNDDEYINCFDSNILVITPNYPTLENKYLCGFVHSRMMAYKESGIKFNVVCAHDYNESSKYNFEGIDVVRVNFKNLRRILRTHKFSKILVHFFDDKYANVLDACDLTSSELYFWIHGPETLYWDWPKFVTPYFEKEITLNHKLTNRFKKNDELINRYNQKDNVTWIFVSDWIKKRSEELINIKFNNYKVIPNIIDEKNFDFVQKEENLRKKIFFLRRFDDCNKYAIDVNVKCILELSKRDFFNELEFNIYGTGDKYNELINPIKDFENVHLYPNFLTHEEIAKIHKENGIALFATRYDAQGVSMCEAAMSGLVVVTSTNDAVKEFLGDKVDIYAETENYKEYADIIERLYDNPKEFTKYSKLCHDAILEKCSFEQTVKKEIDLLKTEPSLVTSDTKIKAKNPILSVVIPSYNVSEYLSFGVNTLLNHENADKLEIIIVNDGSKDNTVDVAKELMEKYNDSKYSVIKLIDKENGGHGSTINKGLEIATGKYFRVMDGDDWVNSNELNKLILKLEKEEADIVVTNYSEDKADLNKLVKVELYSNMNVGEVYNFDDMCIDFYGFKHWGPILATGNFKTEMLKHMKYRLTEKSFYVDMEFDLYSIIDAKTISYYDFDIYRYFIGRSNQSINKESFIKNYKQHENVLFNLINVVENDKNISKNKINYVKNKLIIPMIKSHYVILYDFMKSRKAFIAFDKKLQKHKDFYNIWEISSKRIKLFRKTRGILLKMNVLFDIIYNIRNRSDGNEN